MWLRPEVYSHIADRPEVPEVPAIPEQEPVERELQVPGLRGPVEQELQEYLDYLSERQ